MVCVCACLIRLYINVALLCLQLQLVSLHMHTHSFKTSQLPSIHNTTVQCHRVYNSLEPLPVLKLLFAADASAAAVVLRAVALLLLIAALPVFGLIDALLLL
jgi:hypothetical protein